MEITLNKKNDTYGSILIDIKESDVTPKFDEKVKDYSKRMNIKGFRAGKVPTGIVKKMHGSSIKAEVVSDMLYKSLDNYIKENKLPLLGNPLPSEDEKDREMDWENQSSFQFTYDVGLTPDFKYDISSKVKLNQYEVTDEEGDIQETLNNLRKQQGTTTNPEVTEGKDVIRGKIQQEKTEFESTGVFIIEELNAKIAPNFVGLKKGDKVIFDPKKAFNKDYSKMSFSLAIKEEEAKKLKGDFLFTVEEITRNEMAELNQEFYDKLFGKDVVKSEEELHVKMKEIMTENYKSQAESMLLKEIRDRLIEKTKLPLPEDFLKRWLLTTSETLTEEKITEDFDNYRKEFKWNIIQGKIAEDNKLDVQGEEIMERAKSFVQQQYLGGMPISPEFEPQFMEFVNKYLSDNNGANYRNLYHQAIGEKVLLHAKNEISIKPKTIKAKDFKELIEKEAKEAQAK
ncbi:MAG: trigger factor [Cyclobacteriaceae bacterium]